MKYIIIGLALLYIALPLWSAMDYINDISDIVPEWWDAFKDYAPFITGIISMLAAIGFIAFGIFSLLAEVK